MSTATKFKRAFTTSSTATSFSNKVPTATKPSGDGVFDLFDPANAVATPGHVAKYIQIVPWGVGSDNQTYDMRLWGWSQVKSGLTDDAVWIPYLLLDLTCTLGNIAGTAIVASSLMVDTIVINQGDTDAPEISTADDTIGSILCHLRGAELIQFTYDMTGATSGNAHWRLMNE